MNTQQIVRILIFALIFVVPVLIRIVKAAQEAKERRRLEQLRQYQINEAMRTGRPIEPVMMAPNPAAPPPPAMNPNQSAQERLREMAARRQAQIEALRKQRATPQAPANMGRPTTGYQQTAGESAATAFQQKPGVATGYQQQAPVATGYQQQAPVATGYQQKAPVATGYQPTPTRQPAQRQSKRSGQRRQQQPPQQATQAFPAPTGEIGGTAHDHDGDVTHRLVPDAAAAPIVTKPAAAAQGQAQPRVSAGDLRKAIILREVLGRPVGMRGPGEDS